jgi:hypothetical protein
LLQIKMADTEEKGSETRIVGEAEMAEKMKIDR